MALDVLLGHDKDLYLVCIILFSGVVELSRLALLPPRKVMLWASLVPSLSTFVAQGALYLQFNAIGEPGEAFELNAFQMPWAVFALFN